MESQIHLLTALSFIDGQLDELEEEFGDLPIRINKIETKYNKQKKLVEETTTILEDVRKFTVDSKATLIELKDKEEKLSKKQFNVRNNKEFDAITKEIEHVKKEHSRILDELRTVGVKEENLKIMLESQKKDAAETEAELKEAQEELDDIASDTNDEVKILKTKRKEIESQINKKFIEEYKRIRTQMKDAVVQIRRNSCSGCFNSVPPQIIVEIRNNLDSAYHCEACGRILSPEEISVSNEDLGL
jgi:predicted  nucleic acid-binding Zn-ribbon protein